MSTKGLNADDWKRVFSRLAGELPAGPPRHVTITAGVAMALGYGSRRSTEDADADQSSVVQAEETTSLGYM